MLARDSRARRRALGPHGLPARLEAWYGGGPQKEPKPDHGRPAALRPSTLRNPSKQVQADGRRNGRRALRDLRPPPPLCLAEKGRRFTRTTPAAELCFFGNNFRSALFTWGKVGGYLQTNNTKPGVFAFLRGLGVFESLRRLGVFESLRGLGVFEL